MRRPALTAVSLLIVLVAGVAWVVSGLERVTVRRREAPRAEAFRDPYLALERFLTRLDRPSVRTADAEYLRMLPEPGVLLLDRGRQQHLNPAREAALWAWVERGGYMLVVPELSGESDRVVERLGLKRSFRLDHPPDAVDPTQESEAGPDGADEPAEAKADRTRSSRRAWPDVPTTVAAVLPGHPRPLTVLASAGFETASQPDWVARNRDGVQIAHFSRGRGAVTVIDGLGQLASNWSIGDHDHAELLWALLQRYGSEGPVAILSKLQVMTLWTWLVTTGFSATVAGVLAVALWLWHLGPRFGAVVPRAAPDRRQLREHLRAVGRFVWNTAGPRAWLAVIRGAVEGRLDRQGLGREPTPQYLVHLSARAGVSIDELARALGGDVREAGQFVAVTRVLQRLDRSL